MLKIDGQVLKKLRERKGLTLDQLAVKTADKNSRQGPIDKQTIWRIEQGKHLKTRKRTLEQLAKGLGVQPGVLTGDHPEPQAGEEGKTQTAENQFKVRLSNDVRNAYTLVARRYDFSLSDIAALAPFLFCWAAEESLRWRKARIQKFEEALDEARRLGEDIDHLNYDIILFGPSDEMIELEKHSLECRDVLGIQFQGEYMKEPAFGDHDEQPSPFTVFLQHLVAEMNEVAEFEGWSHWGRGPKYRVCSEEAAEIVGGDQERAEEILQGLVALSQMPKELGDVTKVSPFFHINKSASATSEADLAKQRAEWVRKKSDEFRQ